MALCPQPCCGLRGKELRSSHKLLMAQTSFYRGTLILTFTRSGLARSRFQFLSTLAYLRQPKPILPMMISVQTRRIHI